MKIRVVRLIPSTYKYSLTNYKICDYVYFKLYNVIKTVYLLSLPKVLIVNALANLLVPLSMNTIKFHLPPLN